jgi:sensor histidine kinase regulating citrate/malate metabolism
MALLGVCELLVAVLISLISGVDLKSSQQQGFVRLEGMIISQTIFIYVYMIMKGNIKKEKIYLIDRRYYFLTGTILFLTVIVIFMTIWMYGNIGNENIDNNLFAFTLCVSLISIIAIVLTDRIIKDMNEKHKDEMELQRMKMEHAYLSDVNSALEELRILKHDMRGELAIIHGYNELGQKDKIRSHIEKKLQEMNVQLMPKIDKDNVITSFLNFKLKEARSEKIEVNIKSSLTEENEIDIDKEDICRVLNNIINNAIEACKQCDKKYINLYINILNNCIVIKSENPFSGEIKKEDGKILTIKKDKAKHGYGLKSIKNIAEKYGGFMNVNYINNVFTIEVQMLIKI